MNPIKNKKDLEATIEDIRSFAYSYLEKYSPSKQQLKVFLMKKVLIKFKTSKSKKEISELIDQVLINLEQNKFLNDELYSDSKSRSLLRRGYSLNKINQSLRMKGIDQKFIKQSIEKIKNKEIEPDFVSALKLCKRRRIGAIRPNANRELFYKKDMGVLARAGFDYDLSKRVLNLELEEFQKLIKII